MGDDAIWGVWASVLREDVIIEVGGLEGALSPSNSDQKLEEDAGMGDLSSIAILCIAVEFSWFDGRFFLD